MKIAICYFGLTRALGATIDSIRENIVAPCQARGATVQLAHLWYQDRIDSVRSGEQAMIDPEEYRLLKLDAVSLQFSVPARIPKLVDDVRPFGDIWKNDFASVGNLARQLFSLSAVTRMAEMHDPDIVVFCRPDLFYHASIAEALDAVIAQSSPLLAIPNWQHWKGGYNDRFSLCRGIDVAKAYGHRIDLAVEYVQKSGNPLHSERLLRFAARRENIPTHVFPVRASRVRAGGVIAKEKFDSFPAKKLPSLLADRPLAQL